MSITKAIQHIAKAIKSVGFTKEKVSPENSIIHRTIDRHSLNIQEIDDMQRIEASVKYRNMIYGRYYFNYPEKPYISQDREINTNWLEQAEIFPQQSIIPKAIMKRYADGLLPGHVYMLYWLNKYNNKKIPAYFEYKYGIEFVTEKHFLKEQGFLDDTDKPTIKGKQMLQEHAEVIENHKS